MAIKKTIEIEIKDNLQPFEKEVKKTTTTIEDLNKAFKEVEKSSTDVNATFEDIYGELKPLTARLGEAEDRLYELALAGKQNTQEYKDLLQATANYRKVQIQTDLVVDSAAQTMSQKMGGALQGTASGFALVQGAMGLFGTQSEEVEKALLKVQSAMALAEGIEGVRTALPMFQALGTVIKTNVVAAFSTLKGAIMATGIGALVVAVGFLISKWVEYNDTIEETENRQKKLNEEQQKSLDLINKIADASEKNRNSREGGLNQLKRELELLKAKGATEKELFEKQKEILKAELSNLQVRYYSYDMNNKLEREAALETKEKIKDARSALIAFEKEYYKNIRDKREEDLKDAREKAKQKKEAELKAKQEELAELERLQNEAYQNRKKAENEVLDSIEVATQDNYNRTLTQNELEVQAVNDKYFTLLEKAREYGQETIELEKAKDAELKAIKDKAIDDENALKEANDKKTKEANDKKIADDKALLDSKYQMTYKVFGALSDLTNSFTAKNEKDARRQFQINKALSLSQAAIQTFQAVTGALTAGGNPVKLATGIQFVEAGIAAAVGGANIAKIAATQFGGFPSSNDSSSTSSSDSSSPQTQQAPSFNLVGNGGIGQLQTLNQAPVQAYVVSGEVTSQQALDRNRLRNATF